MSQENVEAVRQHYAALGRGGYAAVLAMYGDDFEQDLTEASIRDRLAARRHESGVYLASPPDA